MGARSQRGQTAVEYLGMILVVAALIAVLSTAATGWGSDIAQRIGCAIQFVDCPGEPTTPTAPSAVDPQLTAAERAALLGAPKDAQDALAGLTPEERRWLAENDPDAARGADAAQTWAERRDLLDRYQATSLQEFLDEKGSEDRDERMNWTDDGCSAPVVGSTGASFDFTSACERHDYGYRNSKELDLFADRKDAIDARFYADMRDHCASRSVFLRSRCYRWAATFYAGVRAFG